MNHVRDRGGEEPAEVVSNWKLYQVHKTVFCRKPRSAYTGSPRHRIKLGVYGYTV